MSVDLLRQRLEESGLTAREFATCILVRDSRTVRRWISGASPIPHAVIEYLELIGTRMNRNDITRAIDEVEATYAKVVKVPPAEPMDTDVLEAYVKARLDLEELVDKIYFTMEVTDE